MIQWLHDFGFYWFFVVSAVSIISSLALIGIKILAVIIVAICGRR